MKVLIATAVYYPMINGVAMFSHNLARGLSERGVKVAVVCPSQKKVSYLKREDGVDVHFLKSVEAKVYPDQIHGVPKKKRLLYKHGFKVSVFPRREIRKVLCDFQPDVVHVQVSDPIGVAVVSEARKMGIPVVATEHNQPEVLTEPLHLPKFMRRPVNSLLSSYFVSRLSRADFVTMPTEQAIRNLIATRKKPFLVPVAAVSNGVDLSHFEPGKANDEIYTKYNIPQNVPIMLYVGRVDPEKKVGVVIDAFGKFLDKVKENKVDKLSKTCLVIVGDGVDKNRLEKKVVEMGISSSVLFLGRVLPPDLYELYKVGDIFVTASEIETQGIVLIEAAATGLPLIAVDKGAVAEVCLNGVNGCLCGAGNVDEIVAAMMNIISSDELRDRYSKKSIEIACEHDFEKTLDRFVNIYEKVSNS